MNKNHKILFFLIIAIALIVYILTIDLNYIGTYNDDAWYINAARYLAGVQSEQEQLSGRPLGYPMLLAPVAKLFPDSVFVFRITSLVFIVSILLILFYFLRDIFEPKDFLIYTALLALNQYFIILSGDVLSEIPYLLFTFTSIITFKNLHDREGNKILKIFLLSVSMAAMFYIRNQGIIFFAAFAVYFIYKKKFRDLIYLTFFYLLLVSPLFLGMLPGEVFDKYMFEIGETYGKSSFLGSAASNLLYYFKLGLFTGIFGMINTGWNSFVFVDPIVISVSVVIFLLILTGFIFDKRNKYLIPVKLYVCFYLIVHVFWVNVSLRYLIPVLPFLLYYLIAGLNKTRKIFYFTFIILLFGVYVNTAVSMIVKSNSEHNRGSYETFNWIKENTEKESILCSNFSERLYLNTGRKSLIISEFDSRDDFYYRLLKNKVDYIVMFSSDFIQKSYRYSIARIRHRRMRFYLQDKMRFNRVYIDSDEKTVVWKVSKNKDFIEASIIAAEGMAFYFKRKLSRSVILLKNALEVYPEYPSVLMNLALVYIEENDYVHALEILNGAIELYPNDPDLLALRGNVYVSTGNKDMALNDLEKAVLIADFLKELSLVKRIKKNMELTK